jgi:prepilin-type N-terminal cleavage/methylation domain-containing protein
MQKKGFTLIELLVVISIISLLSSVILASLSSARAKAKGAKQKGDLIQLRTAIEAYYNDNGSYPSTGGSWWALCPSYNPGGTKTNTGASGYIPNLAPTYIPVLPTDPNSDGAGGCYLYRSDANDYKLIVHGTFAGVTCSPGLPTSVGLWEPARSPSQCTIGVYTPGASGW